MFLVKSLGFFFFIWLLATEAAALPASPIQLLNLLVPMKSPFVVGSSWRDDCGKHKTRSIWGVPAVLFYLLDRTGKCVRGRALMESVFCQDKVLWQGSGEEQGWGKARNLDEQSC